VVNGQYGEKIKLLTICKLPGRITERTRVRRNRSWTGLQKPVIKKSHYQRSTTDSF